jgi:hypothetical protein
MVAAAAEVVGPDAGTLVEDPETGESQYSGVLGPIATKVASAPGMKQLKGGSGGTILHLNILQVLGKNKLVVWAKTRAAFATAARCVSARCVSQVCARGVSARCVSGVCQPGVCQGCVSQVCARGVSARGVPGVCQGCVSQGCARGVSARCVPGVCLASKSC